MGEIHFQCPAHQRDIDSGIHVDDATLQRTRLNLVHVPCPHCGRMHRFLLADAQISLAEVAESPSVAVA
jgi:hypothetical protein